MVARVKIKRLPHAEGLPLPVYGSEPAAGADLYAAIESPVELAPGDRSAVATGLIMQIPPGYEGQIRPRSGLALRHGLSLVNAPGTVDSAAPCTSTA